MYRKKVLYKMKRCKKCVMTDTRPGIKFNEDGVCYQNKKMISNPDKLLQFIKSCKNPKALYVSVSTFLNPHRTHGFFANQKVASKRI